jgi:hypothetical protein
VCREIGYTGWRDRLLTPVTTMQLFVLQILHDNTAYSHLPYVSVLRFTTDAYGQTCARLPVRFIDLLLERFSSAVQHSTLDEGGGMVLVHSSSMARAARCLILLPSRTPSANRRCNGRGVAVLSLARWGCFMPAPVCS